MCLNVCTCSTYMLGCPQTLGEGVRSPGTEVSGSCEPRDVCAGNVVQILITVRAALQLLSASLSFFLFGWIAILLEIEYSM